jgi:hypothetical protein
LRNTQNVAKRSDRGVVAGRQGVEDAQMALERKVALSTGASRGIDK